MENEWLIEYRRRLFGRWSRPEHTIVEFGARDLWNLRALSAAQKYVCAPRAEKALFEQAGIRIYENAASIPLASADLIFCDTILEYLTQPTEEILCFARALRPRGIIVVHALYDPDFRHPRFDRPVEHYFSWNVQTLGNLLIDCGFTFIEGSVQRLAHEKEVIETGNRLGMGRIGFAVAEKYAKLFHPHRQVCVAARQPESDSGGG